MNEGEKILWNAINQIAWGSEDNEPPFRAAPREIFIELARKAIEEYRHLTSSSSRAAGTCVCPEPAIYSWHGVKRCSKCQLPPPA